METAEIIEGNKLIAEFMQIPKCDRCPDCGKFKFGAGNFSSPEEMSYHSRWDWLMKVVENIENIEMDEFKSFAVDIENSECTIKDYRSPNHAVSYTENENKIIAVYRSIIEFIKWYNNQPKP